MTETAAVIASLVLLGLCIFQSALIMGAPIGNYAWGGSNKVLPTKLRLASLLSIVLYIVFSLIILTKSGIISISVSEAVINTAMWALTGYFFLGILMNGVSRSKSERAVMTPVAAVLALLFLFVALQ